jgi:hypothetical protein
MPRLEIARKRLAEADATVAALRDISHRHGQADRGS